MNKIYKVIWSKTKNCYIVASELAKSCTKAPSMKGVSRTLICGVLACVIGTGIVAPVYAYDGSGAIGYDSIAIGDAKAAGAGSVAVGSQALTTGTNSIAIGTYATATGDGTTREEINAILANNKAIRDALNDARAGYTESKAEYDRQKEIFDGQNEAVARVNHANELIAGYQNEINSTLQPNADSANSSYVSALNDYNTLKNDLDNRLNAIKYLDFSLYNNTQGQFNLSAAAAQLKSDTETGTSFDLPQSFYENYITNYIRAEGDLRTNKNIATDVNYKKTVAYKGIEPPPNSGSSDPDIPIIIIDDPLGDEPSDNSIAYYKVQISKYVSGSTIDSDLYTFLQNTGIINDSSSKASLYNKLINEDYLSFVKSSEIDRLKGLGYSEEYINSVVQEVANNKGLYNSDFTVSNSTNDFLVDELDSSRYGSTKQYLNTAVLNDTQYNAKISDVNSRLNTHLTTLNNIKNDWLSTSYVQNNSAAAARLEQETQTYINNLTDKANFEKAIYQVGHEQYLYEKYRDEGNQTEALRHLGLKENAVQTIIDDVFKGDESKYNLWASNTGRFNNSDFGIYSNYLTSVRLSVGKELKDDVLNWLNDNLASVEDATEVALAEVNANLDAELATKQQALTDATNAKNAADEALANKQQQIADTTPSQQDLDDAAAAEATAQDLAQKEAKLNADEEALEEAKANLQNLETISTGGESAIAIGGNAVTTGLNGIGIGTDALVTGEEAIGIGKNSVASGKQSIAIGTNNSVSKANSIVIGTNNGVTGANSIAIGNNNVISGQNSVAIGNNLNVSEDNVVLLGTRRVTGVVDGQSATDAATVGQTFELVAGSGMTVEEDGVNAIGQKKYKLNSTATGGTTYVSGDNIVIEDDVISAQGLIKYDGADKQSASLEGTRGTKLTNLKAASLVNGSTDAVIGHQLYQTNENIRGFAQDIQTNSTNITNLTTSVTNALNSVSAISTTVDAINNIKADASLNNLTDTGRQVIASAAANAVQEYMVANGNNNSSNTSSTSNGLLGGTRMLMAKAPMLGATGGGADTNYVIYDDDTAEQITLEGPVGKGTLLTGLAEGQLSAASTDAVTGSQVYELGQRFNEWDSAMSNLSSAVGVAQADISNLKTNYIIANSDINTLKTQVNAGFNVLANGAKVKNVNPDSNYVNFVAGNNIKLEDNNGSLKISYDSEGQAVHLENGRNTTVVTTVDDTGTHYSIDVNDNGQIASGETRLVTGDTIYQALQNIDVSADGTVSEGNTKAISGGTAYSELRPANGTYVATNNTTAQNLSALDHAVKEIADATASEITDIMAVHYDGADKSKATLGGNGGTTLDNVKDGTISDISMEAVNGRQLNATNVAVGRNAVNIQANTRNINNILGDLGTISDGNYIDDNKTFGDNLGILDEQLKNVSDAVDSFQGSIDNKANVDLDNLSDAGTTVISNIAKDSVKVQGSGRATVTSAEVDGATVYTVDVKADGQVAQGNDGIVTGGTVYDALQAQRNVFDNALDGKANVDASNVTDVEAWGEKIATGEVAYNDVRAVSGDTVAGLADTLRNEQNTALAGKADTDLGNITNAGREVIHDIILDDLDTKANVGLDNITDDGKQVIRDTMKDDLAKKADLTYVNNKLSTKADKDSVYTKVETDDLLSDKADIAYVDEGLAQKADKVDLAKKANVDASNIKVDAWDKVLGTGQIAEGETHLVNGGTVYDAIQQINRGNGLVEMKDDIIYMGAKEGGKVISVYNKDGDTRVITGVQTNPNDASSAANVGYVNAVGEGILQNLDGQVSKMNSRMNQIGANAAAMASLEPVSTDGDEKWTLSASVGNYRDETAGAVGLFYRPSDNVLVNVRGTVGSSENMVGGGVSVALDKGSVPGVTKAQLVRTVNSQAEKITQQDQRMQQQEQVINAQGAKLAQQDNRIAQLEAVVNKLTKEKNSTK